MALRVFGEPEREALAESLELGEPYPVAGTAGRQSENAQARR
jgi:hypothetical protein